ncbi:hypothetical protein BB558_001791 [Smittium angustum]|uniref:IST1-like protein n=1 Tax=Smittium angustum TaxID=133377 RepID=A0A2U1JAE0_SMIAN|nr:hypothetical protein BB558_001791 [Smittium angustum]
MQKASGRLKIDLRLATKRLQLAQQKKRALNNQACREIALLLENNKLSSAEIKVEKIIQQDFFIEGLEILELFCEKLQVVSGMFDHGKPTDPTSMEAVATIIYAASRANIKELLSMKEIFTTFYGKEFVLSSLNDTNNLVDQKLKSRITIQRADPNLVKEYLKGIAQSYNLSNNLFPDESDDNNGGNAADLAESAINNKAPEKVAEPEISLPNVPTTFGKPTQNNGSSGNKSGEQKSINELMARFEALKKK